MNKKTLIALVVGSLLLVSAFSYTPTVSARDLGRTGEAEEPTLFERIGGFVRDSYEFIYSVYLMRPQYPDGTKPGYSLPVMPQTIQFRLSRREEEVRQAVIGTYGEEHYFARNFEAMVLNSRSNEELATTTRVFRDTQVFQSSSSPLNGGRSFEEIQVWTDTHFAVRAGQDFTVSVKWRTVFKDNRGRIVGTDMIREVKHRIPGSNHPVPRCLNVYEGQILLPELGGKIVPFTHLYESYDHSWGLSGGDPRRTNGNIENCKSDVGVINVGNGYAVSPAEFEMMVRVVIEEAGVTGPEGMYATAMVIADRLRSGQHGPTLGSVMFQPGQFDAVTKGRHNRINDIWLESWIYPIARDVTMKALLGDRSGLPKSKNRIPKDDPYAVLYFYNPNPNLYHDNYSDGKCFHRVGNVVYKFPNIGENEDPRSGHIFTMASDLTPQERRQICDYMITHDKQGRTAADMRPGQKFQSIWEHDDENFTHSVWNCTLGRWVDAFGIFGTPVRNCETAPWNR